VFFALMKKGRSRKEGEGEDEKRKEGRRILN
jgi:hypothetical protein